MKKELSSIYWLWIPVIAMVIQIILELSVSSNILSRLHSENGPHEILQALFAAAGFSVALFAIISRKVKGVLLNIWFGLAALGCLYVTGEELSWGQQILDWTTPDFWAQVNDQQETNLHNTSSWLDQKPRLILLVGIVFGTLVYPVLKIKNIFRLPDNLDFLFPSSKLRILALFVFIPQVIEKFFELFDVVVFARFSEVQELYMFYFVLLYLIIFYKKVIKLQKT